MPQQTNVKSIGLSAPERRVLRVFHQFLMAPGQMLCFSGPQLKAYSKGLRQLAERGFVVKERFKGGYSLTQVGSDAMKTCD